MVKAQLTLLENSRQIESKINKALKKEVDFATLRTGIRVVGPVKKLVRNALLAQPEVVSLDGKRLAGEFGLPNGGSRINNIIQVWLDNIQFKSKKTTIRSGKINNTLQLTMIRSDYSDVLTLPDASITTEKGQILPWLEWLLRFGDRVIIRDFDVSFQRGRLGRSRSGLAVMVKGKSKKWRVPSEFAGTATNNFVTRALDSVQSDIEKLVEKEMIRVLNAS